MNRGEIWFANLEPTSGREQRGQRPVMVLSPGSFNRVTKLPVVCPITNGGNFARTKGFAVPLDGYGLTTTGVVRCDQPRVLDLNQRGARFVEVAPPPVIAACLAILNAIF